MTAQTKPAPGRTKRNLFLGINLEMDPAVAIVENGRVLAFSEEERHIRVKHARNVYPSRALRYCLKTVGCQLSDVAGIVVNWDLTSYNNGEMKAFYESVREAHPVDADTVAWQERNLNKRSWNNYTTMHHRELSRIFGDVKMPPLIEVPHHYTHAFQAYMQSSFDEAVCLTIDGSGDKDCTVIWRCEGDVLTRLYEVKIPHSLGWLYAAFTEYLGFEAYDGEYKVMGLAAFGQADATLREKIAKVLFAAPDQVGYRVDPTYLHYGEHTYSGRFTDRLVALLGAPPRRDSDPVEPWHKNLAFEVQAALERAANRLVRWAIKETGIANVCVSGGVGLNVKMNTRLFELPDVADVFAHPLCSDSGAAAGAALYGCYKQTGVRPERIGTLALGHEESDEQIEAMLKITKVAYEKPASIAEAVANELQKGRVVGWFQGRMEAGPRALGHRSILANPASEKFRDRVNAIVKFREEWRPFCPSILKEYAGRYFDKYTDAPFMIIAFEANEKLKADAPAIVHIDGTARVQFVDAAHDPLYHQMIEAFRRRSGVPVVLNTSFNIKGEPIVCTAQDALRTFWGSGIEVLAIGSFLIKKPMLAEP